MDGDTGKLHRKDIININKVSEQKIKTFDYPLIGNTYKDKAKSKAKVRNGANKKETSFEAKTNITTKNYSKSKKETNQVLSKKHVRKNSIDFQILKRTFSSNSNNINGLLKHTTSKIHKENIINDYAASKSNLDFKINDEVQVLYAPEISQSNRNLKRSDTGKVESSKRQSSDLFGFQRCNRRKRNFNYNMNVIYKFLQRDIQNKSLKTHEKLHCKHYSFENVTEDKSKKKSAFVKCESEYPTHYNLVNFTQCCSSSNIYMLKPKALNNIESSKKENAACSCSDLNICKSVMKNSERMKNFYRDQCKEKIVATSVFPSSKPFTWQTTAVNICQPSRRIANPSKYDLTVKPNVLKRPKKRIKLSLDPLTFFKVIIKYVLSVIAIIIWFPCILIIGIGWLISYPLRPQQESDDNTRNKNSSSKRKLSNGDQKQSKCKRTSRPNHKINNGLLPSRSSLPQTSFEIPARPKKKEILSSEEKSTVKQLRNHKGILNESNLNILNRTPTVIAYPSQIFKPCPAVKRQKNVTFKQSYEKSLDDVPKIRKESHISEKGSSNCLSNTDSVQKASDTLAEVSYKKRHLKKKSCLRKGSRRQNCRYSIQNVPNECPEMMFNKQSPLRKGKKVKVCIPKSAPKLLKTTPHSTCSKTNNCAKFSKPSKNKKINVTVTTRKRASRKSIKHHDPVGNRKINDCDSFCKPICVGKHGTVPQLHTIPCQKLSLRSRSSATSTSETLKKPEISTEETVRKSTSIVKFFPPPSHMGEVVTVTKYFPPERTVTKAASVIKFFPAPSHRSRTSASNTPRVKKEKKKEVEPENKDDTKKEPKTKTTSVIKFFPLPHHDKRTVGSITSLAKTPSLSRRAHTTSSNTDPFKTTNVMKFFPAPHHEKHTSSSNTSVPKTASLNNILMSLRRKTRTTASTTGPFKTTSVMKFFPAPQHQKHTSSVNTIVPKPPSLNNILKSLRRKTRTTSSTTGPYKTTSVMKFFPAPQHQKRTSSVNTIVPKPPSLNNILKSLRRKTRTTASTTGPYKTTSVMKFFPAPQHQKRTSSVNTIVPKPPSLNNILKSLRRKTRTTASTTGPFKTTSVMKFFPAPQHSRRTAASNTSLPKTRSVMRLLSFLRRETRTTSSNTASIKQTSVMKFFPPPHPHRRTSGSTARLLRNTSVLKFFPSPRHRLRTSASGTSIIKQEEAKIGTGRTSTQIIKFFPQPRHRTRTSAINVRSIETTKTKAKIPRKSSKSISTSKEVIKKPTSIIKFFPQPRHTTHSSSTSTRSFQRTKKTSVRRAIKVIKFFPHPHKVSLKNDEISKKKEMNKLYQVEQKQGTSKRKKKEPEIKDKEKKSSADKIVTVHKFYLPLRTSTRDTASSPKRIKKRSRQVMLKRSSPIIKFYPPRHRKMKPKMISTKKLPKSQSVVKYISLPPRHMNKRTYAVNTRPVPKPKIKSRPTQSTFPSNLQPRRVDKERFSKSKINQLSDSLENILPTYLVSKIKSKKPVPKRRRFGKLRKFCSNFIQLGGFQEINCEEIVQQSMKGQPCYCLYKLFPSVYPAFLVLYKIYNNMIHVLFFVLAACIWCPLFCWCFFFYSVILRRLLC